jgi:hypothetical protein
VAATPLNQPSGEMTASAIRSEDPKQPSHATSRRLGDSERCRFGTPPAAAWSRARLLVRRRSRHEVGAAASVGRRLEQNQSAGQASQ